MPADARNLLKATAMPLHQQSRDDIRRRIRWKATNPLTLPEVIAQLEQQNTDGTWLYALVVDLRMGILSIEDRNTLITRMRELSETHGPHGPIALVTQPTGVANAQAYAIRNKKVHSVEVFWDIEEANRWLDEISN
jgi:hypothetical protein